MLQFFKKNIQLLLIILFAALVGLLVAATSMTYNSYSNMVIEQQQDQLLVLARAVSQNFSLNLSEQIKNTDVMVRTPGFIEKFNEYYSTGEGSGIKEYVLSYMLSNRQSLSRIYLLDRDGDVVYQYNQYPFLDDFPEERLHLKERAQKRQNGISSVFRISDNHYGLELINTILDGNSYMGSIISIIDMEAMYQHYLAALNLQDSEYIMVKNDTGTVIMHPDKSLLTFNYLTDIDGLEDDARYREMREMLDEQYSCEEGSAVYRNFTNGILPEEEEIVSFSRMNFGGVSWYVSAVKPLNASMSFVINNIGRFGLLAAAIFAVICAGGFVIFGMYKKRQKLQIEADYLRDINRTLEELHESRREVRHFQKLQTIGALAGGISHEFNNLLTPIIGYSEFIKGQLGPQSPYYEDIDEIHKAALRGKDIVAQILPFSRRETDSERSIVSLHTIVQDAARMIERIVPANISINLDLMDEDANILANATQIHQVLMNLCTNAVQAMEKAGGNITISTAVSARDELPYNPAATNPHYARVSITDEGYGMTPEVISRIFTPFYTTKAAGEGTGLGLSVVKDIIKNHQGFIDVTSSVGVGSCFTVYLPVTEQTQTAAVSSSDKKVSFAGEKPILVADDDERIIRYLKKRFGKADIHACTYTDPEQALADFTAAPDEWSAVILDYMMPKLNGSELSVKIKEANPYVPIIMISGFSESDATELLSKGVINEIMVKPIDFSDLISHINKLILKAADRPTSE